MNRDIKNRLEFIYKKYNRREYVHPDPIEFLYRFKAIRDREIAALIASSLAYGRVAQILKSVSDVLDNMGSSPYRYIKKSTYESLTKTFSHFSHRFAKGKHLSALLLNTKNIIEKYGSLHHCFYENANESTNIIPALTHLSGQLARGRYDPGHLVAIPEKGSACKRMNLFLRWLIRSDNVDPGGWKGVPKSRLLIPLDTHMHRIGLALGFTNRRQANMRTAIEITNSFKKLTPDDPIKYDFSLTRFGIRNELDIGSLINDNEGC